MTVPGALANQVTDRIATLGLTQDEIGKIADASGRSVGRWLRGEVVPQRLNKQRLIELSYVAELVTEVLPPDQVNLWMLRPNRLLEHDSPADRIRAGGYRDVLGVIEAIADGVVV